MNRSEGRIEQDAWWRVGKYTIGALYQLLFRVRFTGLEHIPRAGAGLLASNHISVLDPIAVALGATARGRTVRFLAAAEFFRRPLVGWWLRRIRQIPIRRGERDLRALQHVADVISRGALAGIFPEGGLSRTGDLRRGRRGAARIALMGSVPVIPMAVWGTRARWPQSGLRLARPLRPVVAVAVGPPIPAQGDPSSGEDVLALTERIMEGIAEQLVRARAMVASGAA